ncbi:AAA family ATPase [Cyanothece sp. BG0011]|uniref:AAA family ATPase n=1 Tax=Cyanothece sp. BG0011 TaxID=2082950 RepID=UPI000D1D729D|nr:AAA family ATPase [Cyanothece sp. BG0011]
MSVKPLQKILFGSPGTGKSYKIRQIAQEELNIEFDDNSKILTNTVKTVFHPEYTYADFMGKLLPLTQGNNVIYKYYPGHFLRALGMAYKGLIDGNDEHYLLVIDELNRGNAPAIFGTVFQLLDREDDDWSTYEVDISEMELIGLFDAMGYQAKIQHDGNIQIDGTRFDIFIQNREDRLNFENTEGQRVLSLLKDFRNPKIKIPSNLSILATINTSDESIYYLDSAFKRRWDWEYIEVSTNKIYYEHIPEEIRKTSLVFDEIFEEIELDWCQCIAGVNFFIREHHQMIRRIEDKQIGWWFIKPENGQIHANKVKDKLMFYLWDTVFIRDKRPLENLLKEIIENEKLKLITYDDFISYTIQLMIFFETIGSKLIIFSESVEIEIDESSSVGF